MGPQPPLPAATDVATGADAYLFCHAGSSAEREWLHARMAHLTRCGELSMQDNKRNSDDLGVSDAPASSKQAAAPDHQQAVDRWWDEFYYAFFNPKFPIATLLLPVTFFYIVYIVTDFFWPNWDCAFLAFVMESWNEFADMLGMTSIIPSLPGFCG